MRKSCFFTTLLLFSSALLALAAALAQNTTDPNQPYDPDARTTALYHLDEGSGALAHDSSANQLDATLLGATWTGDGRFDAGLSLDGDDYVGLPDSDLYTSDDLTLEAWIYPTDIDPQVGAVIIDGWFQALNGGGRRLGIDAEWRPYAVARVDLGPLSQATGTTVLPADQWTHLAAVFDGLNGQLRIVVNGIIEAEEPMFVGTNAFHRLTIGRELVAPYAFMTGKIDEVRISDIARELLAVPVRASTWGGIKAAWR